MTFNLESKSKVLFSNVIFLKFFFGIWYQLLSILSWPSGAFYRSIPCFYFLASHFPASIILPSSWVFVQGLYSPAEICLLWWVHIIILMCMLFFLNLFILFIYFWLRWVFVAVRGLSLVAARRGYSSLRCVGFSLRCLLLLRSTGSRRAGFSSCGAWALEHRLSSCGARA